MLAWAWAWGMLIGHISRMLVVLDGEPLMELYINANKADAWAGTTPPKVIRRLVLAVPKHLPSLCLFFLSSYRTRRGNLIGSVYEHGDLATSLCCAIDHSRTFSHHQSWCYRSSSIDAATSRFRCASYCKAIHPCLRLSGMILLPYFFSQCFRVNRVG